jgi:hypothetical protein
MLKVHYINIFIYINYIINKYGGGPNDKIRGTNEYNDLLFNRYKAQGEKDLEDLTNKYIEINNLDKIFQSCIQNYFLL